MLAFVGAKWARLAAAVGAILTAVLLILSKTKQAGRQEEQQVQLELQLEDIKKVREIKNEIRSTRTVDLDKRLDRWMRD
jgi:Flp pilus assembly protein TadB